MDKCNNSPSTHEPVTVSTSHRDSHSDHLIYSIKSNATSLPSLKIEDTSNPSNADNVNRRGKKRPIKTPLNVLLRKHIDNNLLPNLRVVIGGKIFKCHMIVLQCYSRFFQKFGHSPLKQIELPVDKVSQDAFMTVYHSMIQDGPTVQPEGLLSVFVAARFLEVKYLLSQCWFCFNDSDCYPEDATFLLYLDAYKAEQHDLAQMLLARVCKFFLTVVSSKDFLQLSETQVISLLSSNFIGVHSEIEVFLAAVRWLTHDWHTREQLTVQIAKCVRFGLMPTWYLVSLNNAKSEPDILKVIKHPQVKEMITDGMSECTSHLLFKCKENKPDMQEFIERLQISMHPQRILICDTLCDYHYCSKSFNILGKYSYEAFNKYLRKIRSLGPKHWPMVQVVIDDIDSI